jgi:TM2 domain-containing membrane protein YozV
MLDGGIRAIRSYQNQSTPLRERKWSLGVAAVLRLVIPGAGQMYKGNIGTGLFWLIIVEIGYFLLIIPGLILHLICNSSLWRSL